MVVQRKQTVASGVKNDDKVEVIDPILLNSEPAKKTASKKKPVPRKGKKKIVKKKKPPQTASQSQPKKEDAEANIIKAHLDSIGKHPLAKWMRVERIAFAIFLALPESLRGDQRTFSKQWWISENSLSVWKAEPEIQKLRLLLMKRILIDKTPDVIENLFKAASKTNSFWSVNTAAIKLWLQFVEEWEEASKVNLQASGGFTVNFWFKKSVFIQPEDEKEQPLNQ